MIQSRRSFEVNPDKEHTLKFRSEASQVITSATQESLHVSKGLLGPGHCVVVDNEKGSQGLAGEVGRNVV